MSGLIGPRVAALFGLAFGLFLFIAVAALSVPSEATDQELIDWWSESGNQDATMFSMAAVVLSGIALVVFLSYLREQLNADGGTAGNPMFAVGLASASVLLVTAAIRGTIGMAVSQGEPLPGVDLLRYVPELAYALMQVAVVSTGSSIVLGAFAMRVTRRLPAWLTWASFVLGGITVLGGIVIGAFVIPILLIWALAASVGVWKSGGSTGERVGVRSSLPA